MEIKQMLDWIKQNWDNIDDKFKSDIKPDKYSGKIKELKLEGYIVVLLVDRQKPSVEADYSFDEERMGINKFGEIIWGFDSGCSCPSPWFDSYPDCYNVSKTWKEFKVDGFDKGFMEDAITKFTEIKTETENAKK
jgi:hypothetical protein